MKIFPSQNLSIWYNANARDLPWRKERKAYNVWLSEMMLQQTQVSHMLAYYERFIKEFPSFEALAAAKEQDVLRLWSGLGYYSRARNLLKTAQMVQSDFGGKLPQSSTEIQRLPGIGRYSAGAILSIAFNLPEPILDGNVKRVLSRFDLESDTDKLWQRSTQIVQQADKQGIKPSIINQALMELGARICTAKNPDCLQCPLQKFCRAKKENAQSIYPAPSRKVQFIQQTYAVFVLQCGDKFLLMQRSAQEQWLKNLWEFPTILLNPSILSVLDKEPFVSQKTLFQLCVQKTECYPKTLKLIGQFSHSITRYKLTMQIYYAKEMFSADSKNWLTLPQIQQLPSSSLLRKTLAHIRAI